MSNYSVPCSCCDTECTYCDAGTAQATYYVHGLTGITDSSCSTCEAYNTDPMELTQVGTSCVWEGDNTGGCTGGTPTLTINSDGSATFEIGGATYTTAAFDCEGDNTFDLDSSGTDCDDFPATLTIDVNEVVVGCCSNALPGTLTATLSAVQNCDCASGTIEITWNGTAWTGTGAMGCGRNLTLTLACGGGDCASMTLDVEFSDACFSTFNDLNNSSCTCDPLNLVYDVVFLMGPVDCCNYAGGDSAAFKITITA